MSLSQAYNAGCNHALEKLARDAEQVRELQRLLQETREGDPPSRLRSGATLGGVLGTAAGLGGGAGVYLGEKLLHISGFPKSKRFPWEIPAIAAGGMALIGGAAGALPDPEDVKKGRMEILKELLVLAKHASSEEDLNELTSHYERLENRGPNTRRENAVQGAGAGAIVGGVGGLGFAGLSHLLHTESRPNKGKFWKDPVALAGATSLLTGAFQGARSPGSIHRQHLDRLRNQILDTRSDMDNV